MRVTLFSAGLLGVFLGLLAFALAQSALHQILAAITITGGFTSMGLAAVMHTIDAATDRMIKAMWAPPPPQEDVEP